MQVYIICIFLLCLPAAFGKYALDLNSKFAKYREECIKEAGITNADVISQIKPYKLPEDGSADAFARCMLQIFHVLNEDGKVNPDTSTYNLITDSGNRDEVTRTCVTRGGSISDGEATTIFKCLEKNGILVLPYFR